MKPANLLIFMSDEHARGIAGCYGDPVARTPNLDRLAAGGARFAKAYTNSPICVPARASLATGRYVHDTGCWDSAEPYDGSIEGWGHRLIAEGHRVVSVGKLHYRDTADPNGFDQEILPMHVVDGLGWMRGLLREDPPRFEAAPELAREIGAGETDYTDYDRKVCRAACDWLRRDAAEAGDKPWVLFVSFVSPHYPLTAPADFFRLYDGAELPPPRRRRPDERPDHPVLQGLARFFDYDDYFDAASLRIARQAYYGLCSFLDDNIGQVLAALDDSGLAAETRVIYTSDHGEMLGDHGFWAKSVMYEGSAGVPLILNGPGVPRGRVVETPVSLIDCRPTILANAGLGPAEADAGLPGRSLFDFMEQEQPGRAAFSEYHDGGSITGFYMLRRGRWKYVHYVGYPPQLFDLESDPGETRDLGQSLAQSEVRAGLEAALREIVDPEAANARAFADQARKIAELGGEAALLGRADFNHTPLPTG